MNDELFAAMRQAVIDGDPDEVRVLAQRALALGIDPLEAINRGFVPGVTHVGEQFGLGEMFLPDLVLGGEAMKAAVAVLEPELARRGAQRESLGTVVLGTVRGDIHEIGKTLVQTMLSASGFQVHDLGVDVPVERFIAAVREHKPHVLGMSALLTTTMPYMKVVIDTMKEKGMRDDYVVLVGGAPLNEEFAKAIGADAYCRDAAVAVETAKSFMARKHNQLAKG